MLFKTDILTEVQLGHDDLLLSCILLSSPAQTILSQNSSREVLKNT